MATIGSDEVTVEKAVHRCLPSCVNTCACSWTFLIPEEPQGLGWPPIYLLPVGSLLRAVDF